MSSNPSLRPAATPALRAGLAVLASLASLGFPGPASAGPYTMNRVWFGGGQTSAVAGSYSLTGGAGTPLVLRSSNATYTLLSGFWALPQQGTAGVGPPPEGPLVTGLLRSAPNPFSSAVQLGFALSEPRSVSLDVFDVRGARVRALVHRSLDAGRYQIAWDGRDDGGAVLPAGIYWIQLQAGGTRDRGRIVRLP